jgi:hypothetical protein
MQIRSNYLIRKIIIYIFRVALFVEFVSNARIAIFTGCSEQFKNST